MFSQRISKYSEDRYYDLFNTLYQKLLQWIINRPEIIILGDMETLEPFFIEFVIRPLENKKQNDYNEYFILTYSDDIVELFIEFKNICSSYGTHFLKEKGRTSDDLSEFILSHSIIQEKISECENTDDNEYEYE